MLLLVETTVEQKLLQKEVSGLILMEAEFELNVFCVAHDIQTHIKSSWRRFGFCSFVPSCALSEGGQAA